MHHVRLDMSLREAGTTYNHVSAYSIPSLTVYNKRSHRLYLMIFLYPIYKQAPDAERKRQIETERGGPTLPTSKSYKQRAPANLCGIEEHPGWYQSGEYL